MLDQLSEQQFNSIVGFVLRQNAEPMARTMRGNLQARDLIATGAGINSIESSVSTNSLVISGEDYLLKVDQGQPPGTVANLQDLEVWVTARGLAPPENVEYFAMTIQQAIYKNGTIKRFGYEGANFIEYILDEYMPKIAYELETRISQELEKAIANNINKNKN
jgi:hypothetical protein